MHYTKHILILIYCVGSWSSLGSTNSVSIESCPVTLQDYRVAQFDFHVNYFKSMILLGNVNFVNAPISTWLLLSAMAEGADSFSRQELFKFLKLPNDDCIRKKHYDLTTARIAPGNDVHIKNKRILMIDENLKINPSWYESVLRYDLLHVLTAPMHSSPQETINEINWLLSSNAVSLNLNGNSVLLDSMDYKALWTTAFEDADVVKAPFYDNYGQKIGSVDLMRVKIRARLAYVERIHAKVLALPVGVDGRYTMAFATFLDNKRIGETFNEVVIEDLVEIFQSLQESNVPIEIGIPRMVLSSELDLRSILENFGVTNLWRDPAATRHISNASALPSSYLQRTTMTLNTHGVSPPPVTSDYPANTPTGIHPALGLDFTANRPFVFGVFDREASTLLIGGAYTVPTYLY